jgi:hypothetical protein
MTGLHSKPAPTKPLYLGFPYLVRTHLARLLLVFGAFDFFNPVSH